MINEIKELINAKIARLVTENKFDESNLVNELLLRVSIDNTFDKIKARKARIDELMLLRTDIAKLEEHSVCTDHLVSLTTD